MQPHLLFDLHVLTVLLAKRANKSWLFTDFEFIELKLGISSHTETGILEVFSFQHHTTFYVIQAHIIHKHLKFCFK